jgi:membrane protein
MYKIQEIITTIIKFITRDIWKIRLSDLSGLRALLIRLLRTLYISMRGFNQDKCALKASALTYYSLLSVVPVLAMIFAFAKGFGFDKRVQNELLNNFPEHQAVMTQIIDYAQSLLEQTEGGIIAGIGIIFLFWTVIKVLGNIERALNDIWNIKKQRSFIRKITDYISIMLVAPIFFILSSGITVYVKSQVTTLAQNAQTLSVISPFVFFIVNLSPYFIIWVLFTFIYLVMPNTKVYLKSGIIASVIAGTLYQLTQWIYISMQIGVAKYNAIYGSFAALPLFLIWLQLSWMIVLLGAEISFAAQNVDTFEFEYESLKISSYNKRLLSLLIAHRIVKNFEEGERALTAPEISHHLGMPIRLVNQILYEFVKIGLLSTVNSEDEQEVAYQPARDINQYTISNVVDSLEKKGADNIPANDTQELKTLKKTLDSFYELIDNSPNNRLIKDI